MFKGLALLTFFLLVASSALFPSEGGRGILNPKAISFVLFSFSFMAWFLTERKIKKSEIFPLAGLFLLFFGLSTWIYLALSRGKIEISSVLDETKLFLITFLPFIGALILHGRGLLSFSSFLKVLIFSNALYSTAKFLFLFLLYLGVISLSTFLETTGMRVMSLDVAGSFNRFLTSCDLFTPFLLFFVVARQKFHINLPKAFVFFYLPLSLISIVIAFSRVFIFIAVVALVLALLLEFQRKAIIAFYTSVLFSLCAVGAIGPEKVAAMIELRLFSRENKASDDVRESQIKALLEEAALHPILGLGMGGYSEKVIRDKEIKHLYEVQWLALLAQFGFIGILPLLAPIFAIFFLFFTAPFTLERSALFLLFLGWVASGATNPFVLSLASGVMYTLFVFGLKSLETSHNYQKGEVVSRALP